MSMSQFSWVYPSRYLSWEETDNCKSATYPLKIYRFIPSEIVTVEKAVLQFSIENFRAFTTASGVKIGSSIVAEAAATLADLAVDNTWRDVATFTPATDFEDLFWRVHARPTAVTESAIGLQTRLKVSISTAIDTFEDGNYTADPVWTPTTTGGSIAVQGTTVKNGSKAVEFTTDGDDDGDPLLLVCTVLDSTELADGQEYSCWVRTTDASGNTEFALRGAAGDARISILNDRFRFNTDAHVLSDTGASADNTWYKFIITIDKTNNQVDMEVQDTDGNTLESVSDWAATMDFEEVRLYLPDSRPATISSFFDDVSYTLGTTEYYPTEDGTKSDGAVITTSADVINSINPAVSEVLILPRNRNGWTIKLQAKCSAGPESHEFRTSYETHSEHSHNMTYDIYEQSVSGAGASVSIKINGVDRTAALGGPWASNQNDLDIASYLNIGEWNTIELVPNQLMRLSSSVLVTVVV